MGIFSVDSDQAFKCVENINSNHQRPKHKNKNELTGLPKIGMLK